MIMIIFKKVRIKKFELIVRIKSVRMYTIESSSNYKNLLAK